MVYETPAEGGQRRQLENKARLQLALSKISGMADDFGSKLAQSLDIMRRALDEFGGEAGKGLSVSFNGGKDACVVLYLLLFVLAERDELWRLHSSTTGNKQRIPVVYFEKEEFPEIEAFMHEVSDTYGFAFQRYAMSYKDGMQDLVDSHGIEGVVMGQRRGDPWTESMDFFTPSTPGWAKFTRVNPALEWKFCHVWRLLRGSGLSYCVLYDQGYTSLGERGNTAKNEALRLPDGSYRPAYELAEKEEHLERSPRTPAHSPRSPTRDRSDDGGEGGGSSRSSRREAGGDDGGGETNKRFSSWDKEWESLDAQDIGTAAAAAVASSGAGGVISASTSTSSAPVGACAKTKALKLSSTSSLEPDGRVRGGGWRGLAGLVGWLPVTTVALALVLAAVGLRSSSGSSRGGEQDSAPDKGG